MLLKNGALGLALVLLVLFIFLSGRVAFWVAIGMPAAYLAALGAMSVLGMSLDMVSMFALTMGVGIVVDDAIVVSEHTTTLHRRGIHHLDAARQAAQIMFPPVLAASLTTIAAFLPVLMLGAEVGNIIAPIPIALTLIILGSLIECFLIMPSHLKTSLKRMERLEKKGPRKFDVAFNHFRDHHVIPLIRGAYAKKGFTVVATLCMFIISINLLSSGRILFEFFMTPEVDTMHANVSFSPGITDDVTEQMVYELARSAREAETILTNGEGGLIKYGVGSIGESSSGRGLSINNTTGSHVGAYTIELVTGDEREIRNIPFMKTWKESTRLMPGIENFIIFESAAGGPPGRDLDIRIIGDNMQTTKLAALELRKELRNLPGLIAVTDDLPFGKQEIILELTPEGEAMGFSAQEVARQVRLRNLGGLMIIDFIDMKNKGDQRKVHQRMKAAMSDDKAKHNILPISQLGIMQITRQRHEESNASGIYEGCPYCRGRGIVKSPRAVSIEIQRRIISSVRKIRVEPLRRELKFKVYLHPTTLRRLRGPDASLIRRMERNYDFTLTFEAAESFHVENFKVIDETTEKEIL